MAKFELPPRRFFTVERLADHWECSADDVAHLIETKQLKTVPRMAASRGKSGIWIVPFDDLESALFAPLPEDLPQDVFVEAVVRETGESDSEVWERTQDRLRKEGAYDPVITAAEVARYEAEHDGTGEPAAAATAPTVKPPPLPTPDVAACFNGLHGWNYQKWVQNLGDPAKWMKEAITVRRNKPDPHLWNPVRLALELLQLDDTVPPKEITQRFATRPELEAWRDAWQPYAEKFDEPTD